MAKKKLKTGCDNVFNKVVYFNGKKIGGVQSVDIEYDITKATTRVNISMVVANNSIVIKEDEISFDEVNYNGPKRSS